MTTIRTDYRGRHTIHVKRTAIRYVRVMITPDRGGEGKYVDLNPWDAFVIGLKMIRTAAAACWRRR